MKVAKFKHFKFCIIIRFQSIISSTNSPSWGDPEDSRSRFRSYIKPSSDVVSLVVDDFVVGGGGGGGVVSVVDFCI